MELWNSIVHDLIYCKQKNSSEEQYQDKIERIFERLGWWRTDSHRYKKPIPRGSAKDLIPDIQLLKDDREVLVVEVKKPNNSLTERQVEQLALTIVKMFVKDNPHLTFRQLKEILPLPIKELSAIQDWKKMTTDKSKHTRWFEESNDLMHSSDGVTFAFTTQIGKGNIDAMIDLAKKQGYQIEALL